MDISKMTPTPWKVSKCEDREMGKDLGLNTMPPFFILSDKELQIAGIDDEFIKRIEGSGEAHANASAIVSAVNNTYGVGINPEYVAEFVKILNDYIQADVSHADVWNKMQKIKIRAKGAINKSKL